MQRVFIFAFAAALIAGGAYLVHWEAAVAHRVFGRAIAAAAFMTTVGGYMIWDDFIAPFFRRGDD